MAFGVVAGLVTGLVVILVVVALVVVGGGVHPRIFNPFVQQNSPLPPFVHYYKIINKLIIYFF